MPLQDAEPPFAAEEHLYRRLRADWIGADGRVLSEAIEVPACSVDRELVALSPEGAMTHARADEVGVAEVAFADVPDRFTSTASPSVYETVVVYCPEAGHDAHSEIRLRKTGEAEYPKKIGSKPYAAEMRDKIAARMTLVYRRPGT